MGGRHSDYDEVPDQIFSDIKSADHALLAATHAFNESLEAQNFQHQDRRGLEDDRSILAVRDAFRAIKLAVFHVRNNRYGEFFIPTLQVMIETASRSTIVEDWMKIVLADIVLIFLHDTSPWRLNDPFGDTMLPLDWILLRARLTSISNALNERERENGLRDGRYFGMEPIQ